MKSTQGIKINNITQNREWLEHCASCRPDPGSASQSFRAKGKTKSEVFFVCCTLGLCLLSSYIITLTGLRIVEGMLQASPDMGRGLTPSSFRF